MKTYINLCKKTMVLVSIEGNIGAGKSALCRLLKDNEMHVSPEPVMDWNVKGEGGAEYNVLKYFYENPSMYACMFQTLILRTRVEQSRKLTHGFIERCVHSDKMFGAMQFERGNMNDVQYATYLYQFRQAIRDTPTIHGHIYLRTDVDTCGRESCRENATVRTRSRKSTSKTCTRNTRSGCTPTARQHPTCLFWTARWTT